MYVNLITYYITELSNGEEIMTTMEPPTLFEGEETEPQTTTEEYEGNFSISGQILRFRNCKAFISLPFGCHETCIKVSNHKENNNCFFIELKNCLQMIQQPWLCHYQQQQ